MLTILNYNENKVKEGIAKCIHENLFGCPTHKLTFHNKLNGFKAFMDLNRRATAKAIHISLNFHPGEKLSANTLKDIAETYMERIGFGEQPYLVYQHFDAGHPHIHIVTTNIRRDGNRIILYNIGRNQSEKARKEIEKQFQLVKAAGRKQSPKETPPVKLTYGKAETRRTLSNIVRSVIRTYRYTSLPELNAVLRQYNIQADRGSERSRMYSKGGLYYRVLDANGNKTGVPIKASSIFGKPTLKYLEKQFRLNKALRQPHKARLIECINAELGSRKKTSLQTFIQSLHHKKIDVVLRQNNEGRIYGITFIDNNTRCVFNGSDLGKAYSAKPIMERLSGQSKGTQHVFLASHSREGLDVPAEALAKVRVTPASPGPRNEILAGLLTAEPTDFQSPDAATRKRKKKKRKRRAI